MNQAKVLRCFWLVVVPFLFAALLIQFALQLPIAGVCGQ